MSGIAEKNCIVGYIIMRLVKILFIPVLIITAISCFGLIESRIATRSAAVNLNVDAASTCVDTSTTEPGLKMQPLKKLTSEKSEQLAVESEGTPVYPTPDRPELEIYKGPVRHIFFHPLIIYPERAFTGGSLSKGFNDWFITVTEFRKILESIYENNYILVGMDSVCSIEEQNGVKTVKPAEMLLPKGKKPLVISIDDMNYYDYMIDNGCASKLYFDRRGYMAVESGGRDGIERLTYEDIVPIVDEFVRLHPDFSLNGAKGVIALTGYEGILGYRTNKPDSPEYEADKTQAGILVNMLKDEGWSFACHGFGHLDAVKVSTERLQKDCERWKEEVEPLIGKTSVYIYPYGSSLKFADEKFKLLKKNGFSIFCGVGPDGYIEFKGDFAYLERKSIDGLSIVNNSRYLKDLFDCNKVLDKVRPKEY